MRASNTDNNERISIDHSRKPNIVVAKGISHARAIDNILYRIINYESILLNSVLEVIAIIVCIMNTM